MTKILDSQVTAVRMNMRKTVSLQNTLKSKYLYYKTIHTFLKMNKQCPKVRQITNNLVFLKNHTLKNNRAYGKYRVQTEGSNHIQFCNQNTDKSRKNSENY